MNLIYIADPMCSWCYGFGKTIAELLAEPGEAAPLQLALVMGGLRPFTTEPMAVARVPSWPDTGITSRKPADSHSRKRLTQP